MRQTNPWLVIIIGIAIGLGGGYWYGNKTGYEKAAADLKAAQEAVAKKAAEDAAKQANPFQGVNPVQGIDTNPFEKAKKALNPFE